MSEELKGETSTVLAKTGKVGAIITILSLLASLFFPQAAPWIASIASGVLPLFSQSVPVVDHSIPACVPCTILQRDSNSGS